MAGHGDASRTTVLVDAGLPNNALDCVAISKRLGEGFQDYRADTFLFTQETQHGVCT